MIVFILYTTYNLKYIGIDVYIHRNTYDNEKDFGVSSDRIKESIMKA